MQGELRKISNQLKVTFFNRYHNKDHAIISPMLKQLVQPTKSTIGEALLIKQGWKPGQGIGPKTVKRVKNDR